MKPRLRRERVLVFEDDDTDFVPLDQALRAAGYHVTRAATPDHFREHKPYANYALILMDLYLHETQKVGIDLTREVHEVNPHVPIVVVSKMGPSRHDVAESFRAGARDYLDKDELLSDAAAAIARIRAMAADTDERRLEEQLPLPMAFLYRDLRRSHTSARRRLERLVELFEVTLKVIFFALLAAQRATLREALRSDQRSTLAQPSLGHLLGMLIALPEAGGFLNRLSRVVQRREFRDICGGFIQLRNDYVGHGAPQREPVYIELVERHQPRIDELLKLVGCLQDWQLVVPLHSDLYKDGIAYKLRVFRGSNPEPTVDQRKANLALIPILHVHLVDSDFTQGVDLFPWCQYLVCGRCLNEKLFLYRMARHGELRMLDHIYGHTVQTASGWTELEAVVSNGALH